MKNVLITGANSYIGTSVEKWLMKEPDQFHVATLDMQDPNWREFDFSRFDVVYHVAGIAHVSSKKKLAPLYFKVNRDLAIETAEKARNSGVKQFIFMSSMIIYGKDNKIGDYRHIDINKYAPINAYGQSKLDADLAIQKMNSELYFTVVIRTPVVYGPKSKGNFPKLQKIALKLPLFPNISNQRSMIYIDNLCEFIKLIIKNNDFGVFYPQNERFVSTKEIIRFSREINNRKYRETKVFNLFIKCLSILTKYINKIFGNKYYEMKVSNYTQNYRIVTFENSMKCISNVNEK